MTGARPTGDLEDLLRPLSARSVVASALLGTYPPSMPGHHLVAFGERFGISPGTTRVALSRMIDSDELVNDGGVYTLAGALLERQHRQDRSRTHIDTGDWDGRWEQAVIAATGRDPTVRSRLRRGLAALGLGEVRDGVWMRPANLDPGRDPSIRSSVGDHVHWFGIAPLEQDAAASLVDDAFDTEPWATRARALTDALTRTRRRLGADDGALVDGFMLAAAALRHFVHDPRLPETLTPPDWPATELREAYEGFQDDFSEVLASFFRSQRDLNRASAQPTK